MSGIMLYITFVAFTILGWTCMSAISNNEIAVRKNARAALVTGIVTAFIAIIIHYTAS